MIEFVFYIFYYKKLSKLLRIFFICTIIFLVNLFFYDGKIILQFWIFRITDNGFINAIQKSLFLLNLFFFSNNLIQDKIYNLIFFYIKNKDNLIVLSIKYFYSFLELINKNFSLKKIIISIIRRKRINYDIYSKEINYNLKIPVITYNLFIILVCFVYIIFYSLKILWWKCLAYCWHLLSNAVNVTTAFYNGHAIYSNYFSIWKYFLKSWLCHVVKVFCILTKSR